MQNSFTQTASINRLRIIFAIVLLEYMLFIFSGVSFSSLQGDPFFSLQVDPASWIFYLLRIPQFIADQQWLAVLLDIAVVILLLLFILDPNNNRVCMLLFVLLLLFYVTLTGYLTHRNYQSGIFMVFVPFLFRKDLNRAYAFEAVRYFILFFYFSAALLKLSGYTLTEGNAFSHLLTGQFTPYFLEGNTGLRTDLNLYLIDHPGTAHTLYILSFIAELTALTGFFTRRFDKWIAVTLLLFHFSNWLLMDIAPFGQIGFICLLFLSKEIISKR